MIIGTNTLGIRTQVLSWKMGELEGLAATFLLDRHDPTRLTYREIKDSWGSCSNFMYSYGLKPYNPEDLDEALAISRAIKENNQSSEPQVQSSQPQGQSSQPQGGGGEGQSRRRNRNRNRRRRGGGGGMAPQTSSSSQSRNRRHRSRSNSG